MIQKYIDKIHRLFLFILYRVFEYQKLDNTLVAFSSDVDYSDNSRVLYEYLLKNRQQYHYVWLLRKESVPVMKPKTEFVPLFGSVRSVHLLANAKYVFYTHPLGNWFHPRKDQIVVNLWHGIPFKGVKGDVTPSKPQFNYLLCLGDNNISTSAKFVGCPDSYVRPWGYPRLDLLFINREDGKMNPFAPKGFCGKLVIWMPTFRKSLAKNLSEDICDSNTGLPLLKDKKDLYDFNVFLKDINVAVIVKIHHLQANKDSFQHSFSNLIFIQDKDISAKNYQLYEVVAKSDALLTDYSSILADYLVMDKPIGCILDDIKEYEESRGEFMYSPILDVLAGSHIYDKEQLAVFFMEIAKGIDSSAAFRSRVKKMMIKYPDGNNCKRIITNLGM